MVQIDRRILLVQMVGFAREYLKATRREEFDGGSAQSERDDEWDSEDVIWMKGGGV